MKFPNPKIHSSTKVITKKSDLENYNVPSEITFYNKKYKGRWIQRSIDGIKQWVYVFINIDEWNENEKTIKDFSFLIPRKRSLHIDGFILWLITFFKALMSIQESFDYDPKINSRYKAVPFTLSKYLNASLFPANRKKLGLKNLLSKEVKYFIVSTAAFSNYLRNEAMEAQQLKQNRKSKFNDLILKFQKYHLGLVKKLSCNKDDKVCLSNFNESDEYINAGLNSDFWPVKLTLSDVYLHFLNDFGLNYKDFIQLNTLYWCCENNKFGFNSDYLFRDYKKKKKVKPRDAKSIIPGSESVDNRPEMIDLISDGTHGEVDSYISKIDDEYAYITFKASSYDYVDVRKYNRTSIDFAIKLFEILLTAQQNGIYIESLTCDNGKENFKIISVLYALGFPIKLWRTHVYSSYEKARIEQFHNKLRQFYPRGKSLNDVDSLLLELQVEFINKTNILRFKYHLWKTDTREAKKLIQ